MSERASLHSSRRCTWCGVLDEGWSNTHLLISETGLPFCSRVCIENMERDCGSDILIVAESGTHAPESYGDVATAERR